ncbi:MAG: thiamine pyrophosphate-dependent enzyme [Oscillospiraceae bacterium]|nr:thiamine pyrophosphate-dependent enzyme [Oscillospiraceae bacterium]
MPKNLLIDPGALGEKGTIQFTDIPVNQYQKTIQEAQETDGFSNAELIRIYRDMTILREFEFMLNQIKTQGEYGGIQTSYPGPAHLSLGQESAAVGQAYLLDQDDIMFGSHRSHGEILAKSLSSIEKLSDKQLMDIMENFLEGRILRALENVFKPKDTKELAIYFLLYGTLTEIFARENGFHMGMGGSMHAFFLPFGVYPNNAIVGGSGPVSIGGALFKKCNNKNGIVICNIGDGSLGCGPVWEALNFSAMDQYNTLWPKEKQGGLPIVFNIFNNGYGMGGQTRGETMAYDFLARIGAGITPSQMHAERVWGLNPLAVIDAYGRKREILDKNGGPVLLDVITYRQSGHSTSDQNAYRSKEEMDAWREIDPCVTFRKDLVEAGCAPDTAFEDIWAETRERMAKICQWASDESISPYVDFKKDSAVVERVMFTNEKQAKMEDSAPVTLIPREESTRVKQIAGKERSAFKDGKPVSKMKTYNMRDAIFEPILDKFYEDPTLITYGEDVRDWGGAFAVYRGLDEILDHSRLFNAPISEAAIVGSAVGYGLTGGRVIVELMYCDFIGRAGDEIFNQMSKWQAMSAGILKMPVVLRVSVGSKYGAQHSQDWTALCAHIPGLKVCFPATPYEAKGLMQEALDGQDPVVFFESQRLYDMGEQFEPDGVPAEKYSLPFGFVNQIRTGQDITLLTVGATLYKAIEAADILKEKYGLTADIINLCSLTPLDYTKIVESVRKTGRVVLASDASARGSFLNDIARNITELCFTDLDAPPVVVGAKNWITPPYEFDAFFFPQASWILDAIHENILPLPGHESTVSYTPVEIMRQAKEGV